MTAAAAAVARRVAGLVGGGAGEARPLSGGDICDAYRVDLGGGRTTVFAKTLDGAPRDFFRAEAAGLALLGGTGAVAVPEVLAAEPDVLVLEWVRPGRGTQQQAERLGRELAALHGTPAPHYGTAGPLYLGPVPLATPDPPVTDAAGWPAFHAEYRLLPLLRLAVDNGGIGERDARDVERLCARIGDVAGPPQPPAVIHGDLWSGNILWTDGSGRDGGDGGGNGPDGHARLIDPAAQGGHPEADLAFLEMSGAPHLERLLAAYEEVRPLPGRRERMPLHQLHHILIHAALFGGGYGAGSGAAARAALG